LKKNKGMRIEMKNVKLKEKIFGKKLSELNKRWNEGEVKRIKIMMEYGGILLDKD
jgi:hypothetical protein